MFSGLSTSVLLIKLLTIPKLFILASPIIYANESKSIKIKLTQDSHNAIGLGNWCIMNTTPMLTLPSSERNNWKIGIANGKSTWLKASIPIGKIWVMNWNNIKNSVVLNLFQDLPYYRGWLFKIEDPEMNSGWLNVGGKKRSPALSTGLLKGRWGLGGGRDQLLAGFNLG